MMFLDALGPRAVLANLILLALATGLLACGGVKYVKPDLESGDLRQSETFQCLERHKNEWPANVITDSRDGRSLCLIMEEMIEEPLGDKLKVGAKTPEDKAGERTRVLTFFADLYKNSLGQDFGIGAETGLVLLYRSADDRGDLERFLRLSELYLNKIGNRIYAKPPTILAFLAAAQHPIVSPMDVIRHYSDLMAPCDDTAAPPGPAVCAEELLNYGFYIAGLSAEGGSSDTLIANLAPISSERGTLWYGIKKAQLLSLVSTYFRFELARSYWVTMSLPHGVVKANLASGMEGILETLVVISPLLSSGDVSRLEKECLGDEGVIKVEACSWAVYSAAGGGEPPPDYRE